MSENVLDDFGVLHVKAVEDKLEVGEVFEGNKAFCEDLNSFFVGLGKTWEILEAHRKRNERFNFAYF